MIGSDLHRVRVRWWVVAFALVATVVSVTLLLGSRRIDRDAARLLRAVLANDIETVMEYELFEESRNTGLNRERFRECWRTLIWPRLSRWKQAGNLETHIGNQLANHAFATVPIRSASGREVKFGFTIFATEMGPKSNVFSTALAWTWMLEGAERAETLPPSLVSRTEYRLDGLRADRERLTAMGIHGLFRDPDLGWRKWEQIEAAYQSELAEDGKRDR